MPETRLTTLIHRMQAGDRDAAGRVYKAIAGRLRQMSAAVLRRERQAHSMCESDLMQNLFLKVGTMDESPPVESRTQFFGILGRSMKQILIDRGRRRGSRKRREIPLGYQAAMTQEEQLHWSMLLERLRAIDPEGASILSLRFEEGLTREQVGERLELKSSHVRAKEQTAIAWLRRRQLPARTANT